MKYRIKEKVVNGQTFYYPQKNKINFEIEDNKIVKKVVETPYMRTTFTPSKK